ncbi:MAG: LysM peptidoglycan-binding domain-containing protein [Rhodothermales bacterium]|nr:LysM peptidoglycan-binding domain-containing protein [Rhodothermales bacterium]
MAAILGVMCLSASAQTRQTYTVRAGDTLYRIAVNHNLSVEELQALNGITGTVIKVGQVLRLVPDATTAEGPGADTAASSDSVTVMVEVISADTTSSDPSASAGVRPDSSAAGADLEAGLPGTPPAGPPETTQADSSAVPSAEPPVTPAEPAVTPASPTAGTPLPPGRIEAVYDEAGTISHGRVRLVPGQSFFDLAFALGVSADTLRTMNPDHARILADGAPLRVPARFAATSYRVRRGDTLYRIAAEHGISLAQLYLANEGLRENIRVGQEIRIPSGQSPAEPQLPVVIAEGAGSVYPARFAGRLMAGGKVYDESMHVVAHPTLAFGTIVMIENAKTGARTFAEVTDRMPVTTGFVVEVSRAVSEAIAFDTGNVRVRIIHSNN